MKMVKWNGMAILLALLLTGTAMAAEGAGDGREADHAALRKLMANAVQAINTQDMDALAACFTKNFVFTTVDQSVLTSTLALKQYYDRMLKGVDSPVTGFKMSPTVEIPTIFLDADTGYSCGVSDDAYTLKKDGRVVHMPCRWTAIVVKENNQWKAAAVHAGVNVTANPVLDAVASSMRRGLLLTGMIGILAGLAVGMLLARRMGKSPKP